MVNLIYPAVLGTIIVNLIQAILVGTIFQSGAFPVFASIVLVWYFVLDYWVTMTNFENDTENYRVRYFILDIIILVVLFGSFYYLWSIHSDLWFFISLTILIFLIVLWSVLLTGKFVIKDPIVLKYMSLIAVSISLFFYTKITLYEV